MVKFSQILEIQALATLVALTCFSQAGPIAQVPGVNRVFLPSDFMMHGVELDGTLAWSTPHGAPPGTLVEPVVDGSGSVWTASETGSGFSLLRFTTDGLPDGVFSLPGQYSLPDSRILATATDRDFSCYVGIRVNSSAVPTGIVSRLIKVDRFGAILWDLDLTPEILMSSIPVGAINDIKVDEDGAVWCACVGNSVWAGGRLIRVDSVGSILSSVESGGISLQLNVDRRVLTHRSSASCFRCTSEFDLQGNLLQETAISTFGHLISHPSGLRFAVGAAPNAQGPLPGSTGIPGLGYPTLPSVPSVRFLAFPPYDSHGYALDGEGRFWSRASGGVGPGLVQPYALRFDGPFLSGAAPVADYSVSSVTPLGPPTAGLSITTLTVRNRSFTFHEWCLNVDPWGDLDGDGVGNRNELMEGTNPCDPQSVAVNLSVSGLVAGQTATFALQAPGQPGAGYLSVLALTTSSLALPDFRRAGPDPADPIAAWWLSPVNPLVVASTGTLGAAGVAGVSVSLPSIPALNGVTLGFGWVTLDVQWSLGLRSLFGPTPVTVGVPGGGI